jgi:hypothetical protein
MSAHARRARPERSLRPAVAVAVLLVGLLISSAFASITIQENALARTIDDLNTQIAAEQARGAQLAASATQKKTADYIIEKGKQLGWVWPWEALIAVQRSADVHAEATAQSERPSRVVRWITLFIGAK